MHVQCGPGARMAKQLTQNRKSSEMGVRPERSSRESRTQDFNTAEEPGFLSLLTELPRLHVDWVCQVLKGNRLCEGLPSTQIPCFQQCPEGTEPKWQHAKS